MQCSEPSSAPPNCTKILSNRLLHGSTKLIFHSLNPDKLPYNRKHIRLFNGKMSVQERSHFCRLTHITDYFASKKSKMRSVCMISSRNSVNQLEKGKRPHKIMLYSQREFDSTSSVEHLRNMPGLAARSRLFLSIRKNALIPVLPSRFCMLWLPN